MKDTPVPHPLDPRQLQAIQLGPAQSWGRITVFPLLGSEDGGPEYLTLSDALASRQLSVAEVSEAGSVPQLKAINTGETPVLLLDGEELVGAKQNRVLNTSILIPGKSEAVIPVSCTEAGRWSSSSAHFAESGVVMSSRARSSKSRSVSASLASHAAFSSDQGEVWRQIQELHQKAGTSSPTSAMLDAFKAREADLAKAMEAFLKEIGLLVGQPFPSVGLGLDYRFKSKDIAGSALMCDGHLIHMGFFRLDPSESVPPMAGMRTRRRWRVE